ncbi:hypothetical protein CPAV1605_1460 [seawater metagenome]|uniref:Uncharacterized protein n=1 Tax=seawater metagenome TaxID=1561972 RepID=A0A5E8CM68_9ZZZZ
MVKHIDDYHKSDINSFISTLFHILEPYTKPKVCLFEIKPNFVTIKLSNMKNNEEIYKGFLSDCILINSKEKYDKLIKELNNNSNFGFVIELMEKSVLSKTFTGIFIGIINSNDVYPIIIDDFNKNIEITNPNKEIIFKTLF